MPRISAVLLSLAGLLAFASVAGAAPPRPADTLKDVVDQTACVAEGDVSSITPIYDGWYGPRTRITFTNVVTRLGNCPSGTFDLVQAGGQLPNGHWLEIAELPRFYRNSHYLVFFRNTDWRWSPVLFQNAYRTEAVAGKRVLIDQSGHAVKGLDVTGLVSGDTKLFETYDPAGDAFSRPIAVPGATAAQVASAVTTDVLIHRLASYAAGEHLSFGGRMSLVPVQKTVWNVIAAEPPPTSPVDACTNPLVCK